MIETGIVGSGISALHVALRLQQRGLDAVLYVSPQARDQRSTRLPNNVCRFPSTRDRERALGVNHWDFDDFGVYCTHVHIRGEEDLKFIGRLSRPASFVDFRIYLPQLIADFEARGGRVVIDDRPLLERVGHSSHRLLVVATGSRDINELFPLDRARSPFTEPGRRILAGLFDGMAFPDPLGLGFEIIPGVGEIFQSPVFTFNGRKNGLTFEGIPGGPWDTALTARFDTPRGASAAVLDLLERYAPALAARVDRARFGLTRAEDLLQGAVVPTVRRPWRSLGDGRFAVAVGDAAIVNDPLMGQGGNLASETAWALADAIADDYAGDERFCQSWATRLWELSEAVTDWTNAFLGEPPAQAMTLMRVASAEPAVADAFVENFDAPRRMWSSLATAERTAAFIASVRAAAAQTGVDHA